MGNVGLLYVGAVLFINGLLLLNIIDIKAAAPLNLFVGGLQVVTPTYLIIAADGDPTAIAAAAGLFLFGFTYLWVGINGATGWPNTGLGWFSLFVALCAVGLAAYSWFDIQDRAFGVIWLYWAFLWLLFFLVLGLGWEHLTRFTGWVAVIEGFVTAAIPGLLLVTGYWQDSLGLALALAAGAVVVFGGLWTVSVRRPTSVPSSSPTN